MNEKIHAHWGKIRLIFVLLLALGVTAVSASAQSDDPASIPHQTASPSLAPCKQKSAAPASGTPPAPKVNSPTTNKTTSGWPPSTCPLAATNTKPPSMAAGAITTASMPNITAQHSLEVPEDGPVTFWYDHKTRWVSDSLNSLIATAPGSFQDELGCAGDWAPECLRAMLQDPNGDGIYTFITSTSPQANTKPKSPSTKPGT
ncbi:MAG: hypothetical protein H6654_17660 [Ardenticatenaceae bacterium]|nr:hypothetical protein [Ardenticatenaceae bacterium]